MGINVSKLLQLMEHFDRFHKTNKIPKAAILDIKENIHDVVVEQLMRKIMNKAYVDGADRFHLFKLHQGTIV